MGHLLNKEVQDILYKLREKYDVEGPEEDVNYSQFEHLKPSKDVLSYLRFGKERTIPDIGRIYGVLPQVVYKWAEDYSLDFNTVGNKSKAIVSKDVLYDIYTVSGYSMQSIADYFGITLRPVELWIKKYDIETRSPGEISKEGQEINKNKGFTTEEVEEYIQSGVWHISDKNKRAVQIMNKINGLETGLYASIPIMCKGDDCPYAGVCPLIDLGEAPKGDLCAVEISTIEQLMKKYANELEINSDDMVDLSMVRDVVDIDISLMRVNKQLAKNPEVVQDVIAGIGDDGTAYERPEVNKAYELQNRLMKQRRKILKELHATRREKAQDNKDVNINISDTLKEFKDRLNKKKDDVIEVESEEEVREKEIQKLQEEIDLEEVEITE